MASEASVLAKELGSKGYEFDGSEAMSQGWKLGLSIAGWTLLYGIMFAVMRMVASFIPFLGPIAFGLLVGPCLSGGLILFFHKKYTTGQSDFGTVFKGFKFLGPLIVNVLLVGLIMFGIMIPLGFLGFFAVGTEGFMEFGQIAQEMQYITNPMEIFNIYFDLIIAILPALLILILGIGLASTFFIFSSHFIVLTNCSGTEAIGASFNLVKKKFFQIFGLLFLLGLIEMVSIIPLGLGLIVTIPWILGTVYMIFHSAILSKLGVEETVLTNNDVLDA